MTDQPGQRPEERLPARREPSEVAPPSEVAQSTERFTAHPSAHKSGLSPERAAKIVTQSASARWVAFLAVTIVALFVIVYYFYDLGVPGVPNSSRLTNEVAVQQVNAVTPHAAAASPGRPRRRSVRARSARIRSRETVTMGSTAPYG